MDIFMGFNDTVSSINKFIASKSKSREWRFCDGFFLKLKKHTKKGELSIEIHTSGYDETLPANDAAEWILWFLYDCQANGILV